MKCIFKKLKDKFMPTDLRQLQKLFPYDKFFYESYNEMIDYGLDPKKTLVNIFRITTDSGYVSFVINKKNGKLLYVKTWDFCNG